MPTTRRTSADLNVSVTPPDFLADVCWTRPSPEEQSYATLHGPRGYAVVLDNVGRAADTDCLQEEDARARSTRNDRRP